MPAPLRGTGDGGVEAGDFPFGSVLAAQQLMLTAVSAGQDALRPSFQTRVCVAACLAAAGTAVLAWVEANGVPELPDLIEQALDALAHLGNHN